MHLHFMLASCIHHKYEILFCTYSSLFGSLKITIFIVFSPKYGHALHMVYFISTTSSIHLIFNSINTLC